MVVVVDKQQAYRVQQLVDRVAQIVQVDYNSLLWLVVVVVVVVHNHRVVVVVADNRD